MWFASALNTDLVEQLCVWHCGWLILLGVVVVHRFLICSLKKQTGTSRTSLSRFTIGFALNRIFGICQSHPDVSYVSHTFYYTSNKLNWFLHCQWTKTMDILSLLIIIFDLSVFPVCQDKANSPGANFIFTLSVSVLQRCSWETPTGKCHRSFLVGMEVGDGRAHRIVSREEKTKRSI